ncbi:DUF3078 domain-containing protein [Hymenobacter sp. DG25A]|uniref:DUF3078 domain-containing protein n=1 Tax=Hymenobacter sp. DG25A TaxID=1385663 RepID=UPI000ABC2700|nr:DUF3078 domain-containing protein [Hymenobacter sp. DG25A]
MKQLLLSALTSCALVLLLMLRPVTTLAQVPNRAPVPAEAYKVSAEVDTMQGWHRGGAGTLNFSQVSLSNWAAGGQSSLSLLAIGNAYTHYKQGIHSFDAAADLVYGLLKPGKSRLRKNDDRLELNSRYGRQFTNVLSYAAQLNLKTQLTPTTDIEKPDSLLSRFFAPAFILASLGIEYKPTERFSLFLSPATGKFTIVSDQGLADAGAFGVRAARRGPDGLPIAGTGERLREEMGAYLNARLRQPIVENVTYQSRLELFSNYFHNPQNVDVNWENLLDFKVNKFLSANVAATLVYDDDILVPIRHTDRPDTRGKRIQFKETLGIGLTYKF